MGRSNNTMPRYSRGIVDQRHGAAARVGARKKITRTPPPPPPSSKATNGPCNKQLVATRDCPNVPVSSAIARTYSNADLFYFANTHKKAWAVAEYARRSKKSEKALKKNCEHNNQWACSELDWRGYYKGHPPAVSTLPSDSTPQEETPPGTNTHPPLDVPEDPNGVNKSSNYTNNGTGLDNQPSKPHNPDADVPHSAQEDRAWIDVLPTPILLVGVGGTLFLMSREQIPLNIGLAVVGVVGGVLVYKIYLQSQDNPTITK